MKNIKCKMSDDKSVVSIVGTIKYISIEGGFYGIVADDGRHYDPLNLTDEFKKDGLKVILQARIRKDVMSFRMWGTIIEIIDIRIAPFLERSKSTNSNFK